METTSQTPRTDAHQLKEHMAFDHLWRDFARQLETELNEANERATLAEFRLNQEKNLNRDHEQDYLAVWKLIKMPDETVVQAAQRLNSENTTMRDVIRQLYDMTEGCADGAPDASAHDKLCNEIADKLQPFIK